MIKINLDKAKEIHKQNIRRIRKKEFEDLDIQFMKAVELGDTEKQNETEETNEEPDLDLLKQEEDYVLIGLTGEN